MGKKNPMKLFAAYSYFENLLFSVLDIFPPSLRRLIFNIYLLEYGNNSYIDYKCYVRYPKKVKIGTNTNINRGTKFYTSHHFKDAIIEIGNYVAIGPDVVFFSAGHDHLDINLRDTAGSIIVEDHVWIGGNSTIMQGVTIGEGAVVAAGSIVTKNVDPWTVVAGVPAKVIKQRILENNISTKEEV